jgi:hypothetical protein
MAVQGGGGGGRKVPPPTAQPLPATPRPGASAPSTPTAPPPQKPLRPDDQFAQVGKDGGRSDAFSPAPIVETSGVESMVRLLETTREQLAAEHSALRTRASALVAQIAEQGFAQAAVLAVDDELREVRTRLAQLRKRLWSIQRKLKTAYTSAGKTGDARLARNLEHQLARARGMEPGVARALLVLEAVEGAFTGGGDPPVLRLPVDGVAVGSDGNAAGAIVDDGPGAVVARSLHALLARGPAASATPAQPSSSPTDEPGASLRALAQALLPS